MEMRPSWEAEVLELPQRIFCLNCTFTSVQQPESLLSAGQSNQREDFSLLCTKIPQRDLQRPSGQGGLKDDGDSESHLISLHDHSALHSA